MPESPPPMSDYPNLLLEWDKIPFCMTTTENPMLLKPGIYRHYKGPEYEVIEIATHSETLEKLVVYRTLYGDFDLWVRPLAMFVEQIDIDGEMQPRFRYVGEK